MPASDAMDLQQLLACTQGRLLTDSAGAYLAIQGASAADLMSDVRACVKPGVVLTVDDEVFGRLRPNKLQQLLRRYQGEGRPVREIE